MKIMTLHLLAGEISALAVLVASLLKLSSMPLYIEQPEVEIQEPTQAEQPVETIECSVPVIKLMPPKARSYEIPESAILPVIRLVDVPSRVKTS